MTINRRGIYGALVALAAAGAVAAAAPQASAAPATNCYQKFTVNNKGGYVLSFKMQTAGGLETSSTGDFPAAESRSIDMGDSEVAGGIQVRVHGDAMAGPEFYSNYVKFCRNGYTATWDATGPVWSPLLTRVG